MSESAAAAKPARSHLEEVLRSGAFAVTAELGPPKGADVEVIEKKIGHLKGNVDAANVTDNQTAVVRMGSIAASALLVRAGLEPVMQMVCRDRNRIALQSDLLGAYALGIRNCLCLAGDHQQAGNHPGSRNTYDIDSIQLLRMYTDLCAGKFECGDEVEGSPDMFLGAAWTPMGDPVEYRVRRLAKKIKAGARFIQTQAVYDVPRFRELMKQVVDQGLHEKCFILAGLIPLKAGGMASYMNKNVPGVSVPKEMIKRLKAAGKGKAGKEGIKINSELVAEMRETPGVAGVHIMAIEWEHKIPQIVEEAGLLPRPGPGAPA